MYPQIPDITAALTGFEAASITAIAIGLVLMLAARVLSGGGDGITRRAYGKVYSGAPGADVERHPDGS
jgi:hypothetical protein